MQTFLNLGSGRTVPLNLPKDRPYFLVNVDLMYKEYEKNDIEKIVNDHRSFEVEGKQPVIDYIPKDVFKFLETYPKKFDFITIYRLFEHIPYRDIIYFIYLLSGVIKDNGILDIIVPNYNLLAERLLRLDIDDKDFDSKYLLLNMELVAEPDSPHCVVVNPRIMKKFVELEGYFKTSFQIANFTFENRDIYCRNIFERIPDESKEEKQ